MRKGGKKIKKITLHEWKSFVPEEALAVDG